MRLPEAKKIFCARLGIDVYCDTYRKMHWIAEKNHDAQVKRFDKSSRSALVFVKFRRLVLKAHPIWRD